MMSADSKNAKDIAHQITDFIEEYIDPKNQQELLDIILALSILTQSFVSVFENQFGGKIKTGVPYGETQ